MANRMNRRTLLASLAAACRIEDVGLAAEPAGEVQSARGECYAQTAAVRRALAPAAAVFVGDAVGTGAQSALRLHLGQTTELRLGAESHLRIDRFLVNAGGILVLDRGALLYDHDTGGGGTDVAVRTPFGLLAVRGTRFFAGPSNGVFGVFVERGAVLVVGAYTSVLVTDGQGTDVVRPGAEPTPPHLWGAARIAAAMASVS
jgi:hypothetical protein